MATGAEFLKGWEGFKLRRYQAPETLEDFYGNLWQKDKKSQSPQASRVSLARRFRPIAENLTLNDTVLDLGSGPQIFTREYALTYGSPKFQFITLDSSHIDANKLQARCYKNVQHIVADGKHLPIQNESIKAVVSNMALDFTGVEGIEELKRVLEPNGQAFINLCFPALDPKKFFDNDEILRDPHTKPSRKKEILFWRSYLSDPNNQRLVDTPDEADNLFYSLGFDIQYTQYVKNPLYDWYEIDVRKPHSTEPVKNGRQFRMTDLGKAKELTYLL